MANIKRVKCPLGRHHKWQFLHNVEIWTYGLGFASMKLRGAYKCACGSHKYGPTQHSSAPAVEPTVEAPAL